jgi:hypothetical protein
LRFKLIFVLLIFSTLFATENSEKLKEFNNQPNLFEQVPILNDYRINQPIMGAIRWGSVGMLMGLWGGYYSDFDRKYYDDFQIEAGYPYAWEICKVSMLTGGIIGLYQGFSLHKRKKDNPSFKLKSSKIGYEVKTMSDPFMVPDAYRARLIKGITITYNFEYRFVDEFQVGLTWVRWPDLANTMEEFYYEETKYDFRVLHYYRKDKIFSPYYGFGVGLSEGICRNDEWGNDDYHIVSKEIYPFFHSTAGLRINFGDFFFLKVNSDFEFSAFYYKMKLYNDFPLSTNITLGIAVGAKLF